MKNYREFQARECADAINAIWPRSSVRRPHTATVYAPGYGVLPKVWSLVVTGPEGSCEVTGYTAAYRFRFRRPEWNLAAFVRMLEVTTAEFEEVLWIAQETLRVAQETLRVSQTILQALQEKTK
jgi:hypothetical protein